MPKLEKLDYILKAAKLYGLGKVEIEALKNHIDGSDPNPFIERKTDYLFRLYDIYKEENGEKIKKNSDGIINLSDFSFEKSKRRLTDSKIGEFWVIGSTLDCFLATLPANRSQLIKPKYRNMSEKNNFLLPQLAKTMGLDTVVYYIAKERPEYNNTVTYHLTKNFLRDADEKFIQGTDVLKSKEKHDKKRIKLETIIETVEKFIKKHYKKYKLPESEISKVREEIKRGLIKQSFFNKFVFNENESNKKWGLIEEGDHRLRLAPLYSFDYCCGAEPVNKPCRRTVNGKEDIQTFMLKYGKEKWFKDWIEQITKSEKSIDELADMMQEETGIILRDDEKEYYKFMFEQFSSRVKEVIEVNYSEKELSKRKRIKNRLHDLRESISHKKTVPTGNSNPGGHGER